jgi:hypothetical protein
MALRKLGAVGRSIDFALRYRANRWTDPETRSRAGSRRGSGSVRHSLDVLEQLTAFLGLRSIADIPCGTSTGFTPISNGILRSTMWVMISLKGLIRRNQSLFPRWRFANLDIVETHPDSADLIFCKDLVNHLEEEEIRRAVANMCRSGSGSTWLLITNNCGHRNVDLRRRWSDDTRHVDLTATPYSFRPTACLLTL